jgi:SOS-response transcriptional repressors (RecA-mediated autopeptidases)
MSGLAERVLARRKQLKMTQGKLASLAGISRMGVAKIELDVTQSARADTLFALAKALKCRPEWLLYGVGSPELDDTNIEPGPPIEQYVPEVNWVQAGNWTSVCESAHPSEAPMHPCPVKSSAGTFALRVKGESMRPRFEENDLIFVDPALVQAEHGKFVVAMMEGSDEATFKQLQIIDGQKMLKALNPDYPPDMRYVKINGNCRLVGTVVSHVKPV